MTLRTSVFILLLLLSGIELFAQTRSSIRGKVTCRTTSEPVMMATVVIKELNIWATTNEAGEYMLRNVPDGTYTLVVSCLGYVQHEVSVIFPSETDRYNLLIDEATLAIDGVIVTAQEGKRMASGSLIEQAAIQHVQPTDLSDVMQLLPGQITQNPDLSKPKQLTLREINPGNDHMSSLGTLLIVEGATVSNDANMQFLKTSNVSTGVGASFASTASGGTDVRQIPVDNIETIEVIRGVSGVENGDMLSGAVKVTLKKGKSPFTAKLKTDPGIKQFYAGKGFLLGNNYGTLNIDFDYTQSLDDIRSKYKTFNRLNASLLWSNTLMRQAKPLNLTFSARGSQTIDLSEKDPNMLDVENYEANDQSLTLNLSGKWSLNTALMTNLNFMVSGNLQHQVGHEVDQESLNGPLPQPISREAGEAEAPYLPSRYVSDLTIDGKPFYFESKISGNRSFNIGSLLNNIVAGAEFKYMGNNGLGRIYDSSRPPSPTSGSDARPRSYKDIPALGQLALYAEENLGIPLGKTRLDLQAGLRFTNVQPGGIFTSREETTMLDPRVNLRYSIIDKPGKDLSKLSLRLGYGIFSKAPALLYLYPDKAWFDKVSFNYYDPPGSLVVVTTKIYEDTRNYKLKPATNTKYEGGLDLTFKGIGINLTAFYEEMRNGFVFQSYYDTFVFNRYDPLTVAGLAPYYVEGSGVWYNDQVTGDPVQLTSRQDTVFVSYTFPSNDNLTRKRGVEFTIDFGTVKRLRTSFVLDGAYLNITKQEVNDYLTQPVSSYLGKPHPYVALFPGGEGTRNQRLNTNLRTITHIKELRMIFTVTTQVVWMEKYRSIYDDEDGNPVPYTLEPVNDIYSDVENIKYVNPIGYYDRLLVYHTFDPALATASPLADLIKPYSSQYYFAERSTPPYFQINLKLTKEISNSFSLSFYANNVTNYQPLLKLKGLKESYVRKNQPLYFGAELKIKF